MVQEQVPQMPSRQSCANAIGSSPFSVSSSLTTSSISRKDMSGLRSLDRVLDKPPRAGPGAGWRQALSVMLKVFSLITCSFGRSS
jgi:hypothetical protein